ncbi:hypothetical protein [Nitrosomonas sp.]|uniref:Tc toxin subunit A-related protein n=1 Tax=Nitrosomonas sp. TaxID=42353 RepID=UPI0025F3A002|nr:hypothetical protein [Nitrosomonas sp.]MCC6916288.1 hypothetical protein [Nitrosomonas sp.]
MKSIFAANNLVKFHGLFDVPQWQVPVARPALKYVIEQTRDLSYRFYLHQHPYIKPLMQRLIRKGTPGLQAADTEYAPGEISLPYGVDVQLDASIDSTVIKTGSKIMLIADMTVPHSDGGTVNVNKKDEFELSADTAIKVFAGTRATLLDALHSTPYPGARMNLATSRSASISSDSLIELRTGATLKWSKDATISIPAGTKVALIAKTVFDIPSGTEMALLRRRMRPVSDLYADFFKSAYNPTNLVQHPYPVKDLDFTSSGAYSIYNWELFYHVPFTVAVHLSKNQRFAEAQRWFHFIFDPTDDSEGPTPQRFWKVHPFQYTDVQKIEEILVNLATNADPDLRSDTVNSMEAWKDAPFRPHVIARYRQQSYMVKTVMAYLDNLIAWGDSLFRQDTGEAIDEAMQLYVMAANILGPRPLPVPKKGTIRPQNYANLRQDLKQFGTVLREMEPEIGFDLLPLPAADSGDNDHLASVRNLGKALYFCVPRNDKLLGYWDTVADRLFKIRNSLNFQGVFRQLALFEPPIDPAMLARAAAAGLDVGAIVNGVNQPLPLVRFAFLVQKAAEIAQEVKSLGNSLLSAMEKEDGEAMALLRAKHERVVMGMVEHVKYGQLQEAIKSKEGLLQSLALAVQRYTYYERQLGKKPDEIEKAIPSLDELDKDSLDKMKFVMQEPALGLREVEVDIAQNLGASGGKIMGSHEAKELEASHSARDWQVRASTTSTIASLSHYVPKFGVDAKPFGVGTHIEFGGDHVGPAFTAIAEYQRNLSAQDTYDATHAGKLAGFQRREQDWAFQSNLAAGEITQIFKQVRAAQIREAIAEQELRSHRQQMKHAEEIERFLNEEGTEKTGKKTNKALYAWMKREVKGLYAQCFQFAFDIAKKAERALQHELGKPDLSYLQFGYLAGKEGLLAGEKLYLDIKRMEMAYHDQNQREYELTKHVSVLQVDPLALVELRTSGRCTVRLPESLFDMDGPGHYFRRIKTVAVSIPCVTGPYAGVNCTLTLLKSRIRKSSAIGDQYARIDAEDDRFSDNFSSLQSIVTSSAQNDSGLFETNLRDERYLPFENSGVISEWQLQLPANPGKGDPVQFDYGTISDVILHIRYTAREGGALLRNSALTYINELISEAQAPGTLRLFSARQEFPAEWARFQSQNDQPFKLLINLHEEHYPFWSKGRLNGVARMDILVRSTANPSPGSIEITVQSDRNSDAKKITLAKDLSLGNLLVGKLPDDVLPSLPTGKLEFACNKKIIDDLWFGITWKG